MPARLSSTRPAAGKIITDMRPAAISAALSAWLSSPSSIPIAAAATMNGSDVAWRIPAIAARCPPTSCLYRSAGTPRTASSAARKIGTITSAFVLPNSASRSKFRPVVTKNTGMNTPNPIASSLRRNSGCVIAWSRSTSVRIAPAANAPRITSRPSVSASATNAIISTTAPRTRI